ncbi:MAG: hypothetical protein IJZ88_04705 [Clostridia bacterium]|nr:hypothetical protein [Clostridia bacterium]
MSKIKKVIALVMVLMLVMCGSYFTLMSPTTAWSYQSQNISGTQNTFVFADFDVNSEYALSDTIKFKGATAFEDENETLFDSVVEITEVEIKNEGGMPARVYATVKNEYETKGLRYFYFTDDLMVDDSVRATMLKALNGEMTEQALNNHNIGEDGNSGYYVSLNPGESKVVKVALWVEYDESIDDFTFADSAWATVDYKINITMTATQDIDGALVR